MHLQMRKQKHAERQKALPVENKTLPKNRRADLRPMYKGTKTDSSEYGSGVDQRTWLIKERGSIRIHMFELLTRMNRYVTVKLLYNSAVCAAHKRIVVV